MRRAGKVRSEGPEPLPARGPGAKLFCLAIACPRCGTRPALRVTEDVIREAHRHPPERPLGTYRCHRPGCREIYDLSGEAYQRAS